MKCWGHNHHGQLGDNTTTDRVSPVDVVGLASGATAVNGGIDQTCALTQSGGMKCWGNNSNGRLGDGTITDRFTPVDVSGLTSGVIGVTTGCNHSCALTMSGEKCWGYNVDGEVGDGTMTQRLTAASVLPNTMAIYTYGNTAHKHAVTALSSGETYSYNASGDMTSRTEGGVTYTQVFDAENRLVSVTANSQTTQFVYDGDSHMVKKIQPDSSSTIYIGGVYEVSKNALGTVTGTTTYYPAAGAMRVNGTLYYTLKDQVSSASVVLDASGNIVGEMRYYPYGETRVTSGSMFTDRLYTSQRQMTSLGLYDYGARFYSPYLNQFSQPDSIIPNLNNPQTLNRYSYVLGNPIRYNDPTGHVVACDAGEDCKETRRTDKLSTKAAWGEVFSKHDVKLKGAWDERYIIAVGLAITVVGNNFNNMLHGNSGAAAFQKVYGNITFTWGDCALCNGAGGYTYNPNDIRFTSMAAFSRPDYLFRAVNNVAHELGHALNQIFGSAPETLLTHDMSSNPLLVRSSDPNSYSGFASRNSERTWVQNSSTSASEVFADQFLGWTFNAWERAQDNRYGVWTETGMARSNWMTTNMAEWIH